MQWRPRQGRGRSNGKSEARGGRRWAPLGCAALLTVAGCGPAATAGDVDVSPGGLTISPQNDDLTVGSNRLSLVLQRGPALDILGASATVDVVANGTRLDTRPLTFVGSDYPRLPIYVAGINFARAGDYLLVVRAALPSGGSDHGRAFIHVSRSSPELSVGQPMPAIQQPLAGPLPLSAVDSGIPPDPWHDLTVAAALKRHLPLVVYVGEPGRCLTSACGDTVAVLRQLCTTYCGRLTFIHVEVHYPADAETLSVGYVPFHLSQEQPWVYFVTAAGVVSERFEGPTPRADYAAAAEGTLAGRVPALPVSSR